MILIIEINASNNNVKGSNIKGNGIYRPPSKQNIMKIMTTKKPQEEIYDHTEITPMRNEENVDNTEEDTEDDNDRIESEPSINKRVPITISDIEQQRIDNDDQGKHSIIGRRLLKRSLNMMMMKNSESKSKIDKKHNQDDDESTKSIDNNNNNDNDQQQNWWARKDLRLRKLQKKLDQEERQMMELMYGFSL
ncbi:hypothetical protein DERP_010053 [Dermatophagoides pteronyssinus]|uniref:Uncharacterized protein n=1 Tax=Dermatophagoides pteronyssinus TaxID=6956 RepID=A0ABQ8JEU1_DERPT|nr:hypothetical protein DERP_010053 [Dermatophagoides pteronyssinus]